MANHIIICEFLNIDRTEEELSKVIKFTSFEFMKNLENKRDWKTIKDDKNFKKGSSFVRSGKINSYKDEVPKELVEIFNKDNFNLLKKYY